MKRTFPLLCTIMLLVIGLKAQAQKWQFVVMGDDRSASRQTAIDAPAVNKAELSALAAAVAAQNPDFVLFTGDLAFGYIENPQWFEAGLEQWYTAMKPVFDAKIPVYPVRGNHDVACPGSATIWTRFLETHHMGIPQNGPAGEKGLTYYFDHKNARMIGLDDYQGQSFPGDFSAGLDFPHIVDNLWLKSLPAPKPATHVFPFSHEMPFRTGSHADCLNSNATMRDQMMRTLFAMGARAFLAGHDHNYDLVSAVDPNDATGKTVMLQLVAGTAGAPFYSTVNRQGNAWPLTPHGHWTMTYGYVLVQIDGPKATLIFYGRDTMVNPPEQSYTEKQRVSYDVTAMPPVFTYVPDKIGNVNIDDGTPLVPRAH